MEPDEVCREVRLYMVFHRDVIVQLVGSFTGKGPMPFYIEVAAFACGDGCDTGLACSCGCHDLKGSPFKNDVGDLCIFFYDHAIGAGYLRHRGIELVTADA